MNKKILLFMALMSINTILQVFPMSEENIYEEYNLWLEDFDEMQDEALREIMLADSFANKQVTWYLMDAMYHKEKNDFIEELIHHVMAKDYDHYRLNIEMCNNKINLINKAFEELDEALVLIEKEFSIPSGEFKIKAIEFVESHDLESLVNSYIPIPKE